MELLRVRGVSPLLAVDVFDHFFGDEVREDGVDETLLAVVFLLGATAVLQEVERFNEGASLAFVCQEFDVDPGGVDSEEKNASGDKSVSFGGVGFGGLQLECIWGKSVVGTYVCGEVVGEQLDCYEDEVGKYRDVPSCH